MILKLIFILLFIKNIHGDSPNFSEKKIASILQEHFSESINQYELLGHNFYKNENEMVFQIEVLSDITKTNEAIIFSFNTMSVLANIAKTDFTHSVLILHSYNSLTPIISRASLSCSKEYFLDKKQNILQWKKNCLSIQTK